MKVRLLLTAVLLAGTASPVTAQSLADMVNQAAKADTSRFPSAPWTVIAGEVVAGSVLAAAAGYGVGLLAENTFCDDCDAQQPGGDTPGIVFGVPAGTMVGVYLIGRLAPPPGRFLDTLLGAAIGTAVFAGYVELLEGQGDAVRWAGVLFPAGMATMGFNKSREALLRAPAVSERRIGGPSVDVALVRLTFD
jgi:hypothetical protein